MAWDPFSPDFTGAQQDPDDGSPAESALGLPWSADPAASWITYRCWVEVNLDAGMALHKPLPQQNPKNPDTLASVAINDSSFDTFQVPTGQAGVLVKPNLVGNKRIVDVIQRMASSTYRFILKGYALRAGYQVPIPGLVKIGGVTPVPDRIQRAANLLVGNFSGVPVFLGYWEIHYVVPASPQTSIGQGGAIGVADLVPFNPALHIRSDQALPEAIPLPVTPTDARSSATGGLGKPVGQPGGGGVGPLGPNLAQLLK